MLTNTYRVSIPVLAVVGLLSLAPQTLAANPPVWPVVGAQHTCTFQLENVPPATYDYKITTLNGNHSLRRGEYEVLTGGAAGVREKIDVAYKPNETRQPRFSSIFEFTMPQRQAQCKHFEVRKIQLPFGGCREIQIFKDCEGGGLDDLIVQTCTAPVACN